MTSNLKARLLQHFINKKKEGGFTLIELLVVIIIIGILAAIALPSFLNQANRAKETEGRSSVGSIARAQQAYRLESSVFASDFSDLDVGIGESTTGTVTRTEYYVITLQPGTATLGETRAVPDDEILEQYTSCSIASVSDGKTDIDILEGTKASPATCP
jgi:type IV pilus assembly protein PilA